MNLKIDIGPYKDNGKRKIDIKIHGYDVWSMDHTLSLIILPMLKRLKKDKHGAPVMESMKYTSQFGYGQSNMCFDFYKDDDELASDVGFKEWDVIMDKMIWSFKEIRDGAWEEKYWSKSPKFKGICAISNGAVYDVNGANEHQKRIQEGLDLFGKYFTNLWD